MKITKSTVATLAAINRGGHGYVTAATMKRWPKRFHPPQIAKLVNRGWARRTADRRSAAHLVSPRP